MKKIILISGHTGTGKTTLARNLRSKSGFSRVRTSLELARSLGGDVKTYSRDELYEYGRELDKNTHGQWVKDSIQTLLNKLKDHENLFIVVDCVTSWAQVSQVRDRYGLRVVHVHLKASYDELLNRCKKYRHKLKHDINRELFDKITVLSDEENNKLEHEADVIIRTDETEMDDTYVRVGSRCDLFAPPSEKCVDVLVGGQYGSEGKGQIAAYLSGNYDVLVRVGGPNAGHKVMSSKGEYTYHHLPSGCRDAEAEVLIGPGAVVNPENLIKEINDCGLKKGKLFIDPQVMLISVEDIKSESKSIVGEIASTGSGSGAAFARKILNRGDERTLLARNNDMLKPYLGDTYDRLEKAYARGKRVFLEGTQGSGLSIHHGHYPYVTSRDTNVAGCLAEAGISPSRVRRIIMVVRSYPIRVANPDKSGATSGYMKNEIDFNVIAKRAGLNSDELYKLEKTSTTGRDRRVGEFDWYQFRKACALNAPTDIVLTFSDYIDSNNKNARRFEQLSPVTIQFIEELERVSNAPVSLISTRFNLRAVIDRRDWW